MLRQAPSSNSKREAGTPSRRQVLGVSNGLSNGLLTKQASPMTPAKVRARRESERQSLSFHKTDVENIAPQHLRTDNDIAAKLRLGFAMKSPVTPTPMERAHEATRTIPLQKKVTDIRSTTTYSQGECHSRMLILHAVSFASSAG